MKGRILTIAVFALLVVIMQSCSKEFLDRPPIDRPTAGTFYASDADILAGTGPLYNASWGGYNGSALQAIGDVMGGNSLTDNYNGRAAYVTFSVNANDGSGPLQS